MSKHVKVPDYNIGYLKHSENMLKLQVVKMFYWFCMIAVH